MSTMKTAIKTTIQLKPEFIMSAEDIDYLTSLPDNKPETILTGKDKGRINNLYFKYIYKNDVCLPGGLDLFEIEKKKTWPNGEKTKQHKAWK
jgi:hypothetical protein